MNKEKLSPIVKGIIKHLPLAKRFTRKSTGGTDNSRYCYAIWLLHLKFYASQQKNFPSIIAELGPGDSLGIGLAALLSGCQQYYALDVVKFWNIERNLKIFDELVELYKQKAAIPGADEFAKVRPYLDDYSFPAALLSQAQLDAALAPERLAKIRSELEDSNVQNRQFIIYHIPWYDPKVIQNESIDFIFSQSVLEHVEDLENTYKAMYRWLKPGGVMSHNIDFKSHGITNSWNGHWAFSDLEWKIVKGGKKFLINRAPFTTHLQLHKKYGFDIIKTIDYQRESQIPRQYLSKKFQGLSEEEFTTSELYVLSKKD